MNWREKIFRGAAGGLLLISHPTFAAFPTDVPCIRELLGIGQKANGDPELHALVILEDGELTRVRGALALGEKIMAVGFRPEFVLYVSSGAAGDGEAVGERGGRRLPRVGNFFGGNPPGAGLSEVPLYVISGAEDPAFASLDHIHQDDMVRRHTAGHAEIRYVGRYHILNGISGRSSETDLGILKAFLAATDWRQWLGVGVDLVEEIPDARHGVEGARLFSSAPTIYAAPETRIAGADAVGHLLAPPLLVPPEPNPSRATQRVRRLALRAGTRRIFELLDRNQASSFVAALEGHDDRYSRSDFAPPSRWAEVTRILRELGITAKMHQTLEAADPTLRGFAYDIRKLEYFLGALRDADENQNYAFVYYALKYLESQMGEDLPKTIRAALDDDYHLVKGFTPLPGRPELAGTRFVLVTRTDQIFRGTTLAITGWGIKFVDDNSRVARFRFVDHGIRYVALRGY